MDFFGLGSTSFIPTAISSGSLSWARLTWKISFHRAEAAELTLRNGGEVVAATHGDDTPTCLGAALVKIRNLESPADPQSVRPPGQHLRVRRGDLAPISAISVVPLCQGPQVITCSHHMLMSRVIDSRSLGRRGRFWWLRCDRFHDQL